MNDPFASVNKFLDSVNKRPYNPEEEKEKNRIPLSLVPDLNATLNAKPQKRIVPQESREEITEYLQQKPEENTPRTSLGVDYTLDDLEKNPEFQTVAGRFLESVQSNDNIYEYLRDTDWSLTSAIARSLEIDEWSEQAKQDYNYLRQTFDSASVGGLKQKLNLFKNATVDIFTDPIELVAMAAIPFTGGASQGTKQLVKIALKEGLKKNQKAKLTKSVLKDAKKPALFTALEGGAWGGSHNYFLQKSDVELGIREQLDATEIGLTAALAASMGGALGGSVGLLRSTSPLLAKKLRLYSNEDEINKRVGAKGKTPKEQSKTLNDEYEAGSETNKLLPNFLKFISATVGKPTTYLLKAGKTVTEIGKQLDLYKYDWYKTTTNAVREGLDKLSFGEVLVPMRSNWLADFGTAINKIERTGKSKKWGFNTFWNNRMNDRENAQLYYLLTNRKKKQQRTKTMPYGKYKGSKIKQSTRTAANKIGLILDDIHREAQRKGKFNGVEYDQLLSSEAFLENYFPHRIQAELLKKDPEGFKNLLQMYGKTVDGEVIPYAKPNNSFSSSSIEEVVDEFGNVIKGPKPKGITVDYEAFQRDFIKDATEELGEGATQKEIDKLAMDMKADKIYEDMLRMSEDPLWNLKLQDEAIAKTQGTRVSGKTGWLKERVFSDIPAEDMYRYIDNDVERVMNDYITNTSMLIARERVFGRNLSVYATRHLNPMIKAMKRDGVDKVEQDAIIDRFKIMYQKIAGVETPTPFGTGKTRTFMAGMKAMQTFAHLPLATVSSLTEPLIMLSRVQKENIPNAAYNFGSAVVKESKKFGERFNNGIKRQFGIKHTGTKDFVDESWLEVYKVGLAMEQALMDRLDGMYGDLQGSQGLQKLTRGFFKTTLLTQWTAAVQLAAFTTGKRLILENTQRLATGKSLWGNKLSKGAMERYRNELRHLNVDEKKAIKWYNSSLDENGKFDMVRGKRKKGFYENDYVMGANRFSREIILIPDVTEANKPLWYSHPVGQMFAQFASYPTAFNNTILKRFAYETTEDFKGLPKGRIPVATPKIVATAAMMTFMATITNAGRSQGRSLEKSDDEILADSIDRWGGLGPLQYPYRFMQNAEYGSGPIGSVAKAGSGPLIQDILDSLLYRKGLAENIASNVPFQSLIRTLDPDAAKALQDEGKKIDKILFSPFAASKKPKTVTKSKALYKSAYAPTRLYAKGGIVNDVEQVKNEPDERVDRMTGLPYHMQAGILGQDEEERFGFAEGGNVKFFGKDGLIFDPTNPLDYLTFIPGIGVLGLGAKAVAKGATKFKKLKDLQKLKEMKLYHGGYKPTDASMEQTKTLYTTPAIGSAEVYAKDKVSLVSKMVGGVKNKDLPTGKKGVYLVSSSSLKKVLDLQKPDKKFKGLVQKEIDKLKNSKELKELKKYEATQLSDPLPKYPSKGYRTDYLVKRLETYLKDPADYSTGLLVHGGKDYKVLLNILKKNKYDGVHGSTFFKQYKDRLKTVSSPEFVFLKTPKTRRLSSLEIKNLQDKYYGRPQIPIRLNKGGLVQEDKETLQIILTLGLEDAEKRAAFAEGGPVNPEHSDVYSLITKDIRNLAPIYRDDEPISEYTEKELKGYAKGIDKPLYRAIKKDTAQQDAEDFRDSQKIGVHLDTEVPEKGDLILKGFIELNRPLDLSEMDVPLEGFLFVEEIKNNKELKNKIVDDSILPPPTVEEHIEDLLFHHSLKKEAIKDHKSLPNLKSILNITASHKVREVLKDIGYDGIIYEEDTGREQKFAGGFFSKLARKAKKKKVVALDKNQYRVTRKAKQEELLDDEILRKRMEEDFRTLYVYADNETRGAIKDIRGSSANRARGLTNSVGIRTKKDPSTKGSSYYNDYKDSNNRYLNSKQIKQRVMNINSDMANVLREFVSGDYTKIKFSQELLDGVDFRQAKSSFTERNFREKLKMVKEFAEKDAKNKLSAFEMGATQEGRLESLEQTIGSMLYGPRWKRTETQFIKNEEGVVTDMVQRSPIIDPSYKTKAQKSKVSIEVTDRPRDATASDLGVPEDQALYAKGHKESIKRERALDPIPTKFEEFKVYIKELEESNSPYKIELAEELKLDWMKDNPDLPFPDDWIPKIIGGE